VLAPARSLCARSQLRQGCGWSSATARQSCPECNRTTGWRKKNTTAAKPELQYQRKPNQPSSKQATDISASLPAKGMKTLVVFKLPELQVELPLSLSLTRARRVGCDLHPDLWMPQAAEGPAPLPAGLPQHHLHTLRAGMGHGKEPGVCPRKDLNNLNIK